MVKWEYCIEYATYLRPDKLNELGQQGWELVTIYDGDAYFKRPIDESAPIYCYDEETGLRLEVKG